MTHITQDIKPAEHLSSARIVALSTDPLCFDPAMDDPANVLPFVAPWWPSLRIAALHIEALTGSPDTAMHVRLIHDFHKHDPAWPGINLHGPLAALWPGITDRQREGYGVFLVVNDGGNTDAEITRVRAIFADLDGLPLPATWHVSPSFLTTRDDTHWHAYWLVGDLPPGAFMVAQKRLAAHYGSDGKVCNPSRVMRLAGTLHQKDPARPRMMTLRARADAPLPVRAAAGLLAGLPEIAAPAHAKASAPAGTVLDTPSAIARATSRLRAMVARGDVAIEGCGGNTRTYQVAAELRDLGCSEDATVRLLMAEWNEHCRPEWDASELATIVGNAGRYAQNEPGAYAVGAAMESFGHTQAFREAFRESAAAKAETKQDKEPDGYPTPLTARALATGTFPEPVYVVQDMILARTPGTMWGNGGAGKTLCCEHVAVAVAAGIPIYGLAVRQMPVLLVLKEDAQGVTKRRLEAICAMMRLSLADLPISVWCLPAHDLTLATITETGACSPGPFLNPLRQAIVNMRSQEGSEAGRALVILDPLGDFAVFDENKPAPTNALYKAVLAPVCADLGVTIFVTAHPSKAALRDGTGYAGTTAHRNSVRLMTLFERVSPDDLEDPARKWTVAKGNYGPPRVVDLTQDGMLLQSSAAETGADTILDAVVRAVVNADEYGAPVLKKVQRDHDMVFRWIKDTVGRSMKPAELKTWIARGVEQDRLRYRSAPSGSHGRAGYRAFDPREDQPFTRMAPREERQHQPAIETA